VAAAWAGVPIRSPFNRGRPRFPVRAGAWWYNTALRGSRVVQVTWAGRSRRLLPWYAASATTCTRQPGARTAIAVIMCTANSTVEAVPLPRQRRHSTGRHNGRDRNEGRTMTPTTTQR
jgi:hypothetical protein